MGKEKRKVFVLVTWIQRHVFHPNGCAHRCRCRSIIRTAIFIESCRGVDVVAVPLYTTSFSWASAVLFHFFFLFILTDRRSTCEAEPTADAAAAAAGDDCLASSPTLCPSSTNGSDGKYWHVLSLVYCLEFIWLRRSWNKMGKFFFGIFEPTPKGDPFTAWRNRILMS